MQIPFYAVGQVLKLGVPTTVLLSLSSLMIFSFNAILNSFSSTAVAVFGVSARVTGLFYAIVNAVCSAAMPVIAFNHGAKNKKRIDESIRYGYLYSVILMSVGTVICCGFPGWIMRIFNATDEMMGIGIAAMRTLSVLFPAVALKNMSTCIIQALGHSVQSMAVDLTRNYLLLIPLAFLFSRTGVLGTVWYSIPVADLLSAILGLVLVRRYYRKDIAGLSEAKTIETQNQ